MRDGGGSGDPCHAVAAGNRREEGAWWSAWTEGKWRSSLPELGKRPMGASLEHDWGDTGLGGAWDGLKSRRHTAQPNGPPSLTMGNARRASGRSPASASAFRAAIASARLLADDTVAHREKLNRLKDQFRGLEAGLAEALSIQLNKASECERTSESILSATTTNEQLNSLVMDQRTQRDEYANVTSNQLEGVTFVFNKVDMQNPDNEYLFCMKVNKDKYSLIQCDPSLKDSEELVKDLNCTNDLFKFVRTMRARFQAAAMKGVHPVSSFCPDTSSITASSPPALSVDTTSERTTNQSHSRSRSKNQDMRAKRGRTPRSAASPLATPSSTRRSPRFAAVDVGNRH